MSVAREIAAPSRLPTPQAEGAPVRPAGNRVEVLWVASALVLPFAVLFALGVDAVADVPAQSGSAELDFLSDADLRPEPGEQRAYLLLLLAPLGLAAAVLLFARGSDKPRRGRVYGGAAVVALCGQALLIGLVLVSLWRQREIYSYFASWQIGLSVGLGVLALLVVVAAPLRPVRRALRGCRLPAAKTRLPAAVVATVVVLITVAYTSTTVYKDDNIARSPFETWYHLAFTAEEITTVFSGRTPLVDFVPQYVSLLPYLAWPFLQVAGVSVATLTLFFAVLTGIGLLSVFAAFWRVTGSAVLAAVLYLPLLSITFYPAIREGVELHSLGTYYAVLPLRYFFPLLLTALVAFLAPRAKEWRAAVLLGGTAGAGLVNNIEFGIAALGAVVVAVFVGALSTGPTTRRWQAAFVAELRLLVGVLLAVLLFVLGTLVRSGSLPDFSQSLYFSRQFAASGFYMLPLPGPLGMHLVLYLTGASALVMALVCAVRRSVRPGAGGAGGLALLGYSSVFGLGAGSYYVGRSHPLVLIAVFCAWALCSAMLTVEVLGRLRGLAGDLPVRLLRAIPAGAVVAQFALIATTLSGADVLADQPGRLTASGDPRIFAALDMRAFLRDCAVPGERVMLLHPLGNWISADAGVANYFPYNNPSAVVTQQQVAEVAAALGEHDVTRVFVGPLASPVQATALSAALGAAGYEPVLERPPSAPASDWLVAGGPVTLWRQSMTPAPCS
ncbi:MAG: hypothetical protein KY440_06360 [Actinobacteria bacterium]|nr:hypothetical protein [Actinomycetota bacterium]